MDMAEWAQALGTAFAGVGLALLAWQIALQRRDSARDAVSLMVQELNSPDARDRLRFLYSKTPPDLVLSRLSSIEEVETIENVIAHISRLSYRVRAGQIDEGDAYELMWDVVLRSAQQLILHLDDQAERRGYRHAPDFEWLARRFKERHLRACNKLPTTHRSYTLARLLQVDPLPVFSMEKQLTPAPTANAARGEGT